MLKTKHSNVPLLDTLETTSDCFITKSHESQYYNALRKKQTIARLKRLVDVSKPSQQKKYWKAWHCQNILLQDGNNLIGSLCRKRWCHTCERIKTAELINSWHKPLVELQEKGDLFYVTLTAPTVEKRKLHSELKKRYKAFVRVKDNMRKNYGIKLVGIRSTEITLSKGKYHPHFHLIQQGKREAELFLKLWLEQFPRADIKAQDILPIDPKDPKRLKEFFKYSVKQDVEDSVEAIATDTIYQALDSKRTFQAYGKLTRVKPTREAISNETKADFLPTQQDIWKFNPNKWDYTNSRYQEMIKTKEIFKALDKKERLVDV